MNRIKILSTLVLVFVSAMFSSCENEIEINAPYEDVALVYCLLDADSTRHYIKINKLYQSLGDAEELAKDRSAQEYEFLNGYLVELNDDGTENMAVRYPLQETDTIPKDSGLFYYPDQTVYYVDGPLNESKSYKLFFTKPNGENVEATTRLIRKTDIPMQGTGGYRVNGISFVGPNGVKSSEKFTIVGPINSKIVEFIIKFRYQDVYVGGGRSPIKTVEIPVGNFTFTTVRETEDEESLIEVFFNPEVFYKSIGDAVPQITGNENPAIDKRQPLSDTAIVLDLSFADEELYTFIEVTKPSTSLLEDKPPYTNVDNGIGIAASRTNWTGAYQLSSLSYDELATGLDLQLTGGRGFCNPRRAAGDPVGTGCF